ncbi:DNA repair protein [Colletotrichum plurivorum]|uniref:DNA repair protein n=1 Tax=Colletotrichum plurivorum TaxID=2175906 RepID=A0A8H6KXE1_9PEZI|nr:DNA repair protein [Colletotrichum plurivorum]
MEHWSSASRTAVQNAFNALRETITRELQNEVEHRINENDRSRELLVEELEILRSRSAEVDRLEEENRKLRTRLLQFHQQSRGTDLLRDTPRPSIETRDQSTNTESAKASSSTKIADTDQILRESQKLHRKYTALDQNFKVLKAEFQKRRDENKQLKDYVGSLEERLRIKEESSGESKCELSSAPHPLSEPGRPRADGASSVATEIGAEREPSHKRLEAATARTPYQTDEVQDLPLSDSAEDVISEGSKNADAMTLPPLKQTTDVSSEMFVKPEPSSDGPVFVSERHVGKRKRPGDATADEPGPRRLKTESSDLSGGLPGTQIQESMDLDEVGQKLCTPRKNRHVDPERAKSADSVFVRPDNVETTTTRAPNTSTVLTPLNPNVRSVRPYERNPAEKPTKKALDHGIGTLAEDGRVYKKSGRGEPVGGQFRTPQPQGGRLSALLNMPSPEQAPAIVRSAPRLRDTNQFEDDGPLFPERRQLPFTKERREKPTTPKQTDDDETVEERPVRGPARARPAASDTPLSTGKGSVRSKPMASLRLDDFRINPKFNNGSDYAYSEVVRGKDDRACLPGCTDMNCCGKHFRAMALAQKNSADRTKSSDTKLFEDYLGDKISSIRDMSKAEKEELWVEAKTWQLAKELGKHRHRYARRASPPGFWNADFPSTQEVQAEKAEAARREKQMIQERYREAMRGGRWIFRDE